MKARQRLLGVGVLAAAAALAGCVAPYTRMDFEHYRSPSLATRSIKKVAVYSFGWGDFNSPVLMSEAPPQRQASPLFVTPARLMAEARLSSSQVRMTGQSSELFHNFFCAAFMRKGITVVERQKVIELVREQRLANKDFTNLTEKEKALRVGRMLDCDLILYGEPLENQTNFFFNQNGLGVFLMIFPVPLYFPGLFTVVPEAGRLQQAQMNDALGAERPRFHNIWIRYYQGMSIRALDTRTGQIAWIGVMLRSKQERIESSEIVAISSLTGLQKLADDMVSDLLTGGGVK